MDKGKKWYILGPVIVTLAFFGIIILIFEIATSKRYSDDEFNEQKQQAIKIVETDAAKYFTQYQINDESVEDAEDEVNLSTLWKGTIETSNNEYGTVEFTVDLRTDTVYYDSSDIRELMQQEVEACLDLPEDYEITHLYSTTEVYVGFKGDNRSNGLKKSSIYAYTGEWLSNPAEYASSLINGAIENKDININIEADEPDVEIVAELFAKYPGLGYASCSEKEIGITTYLGINKTSITAIREDDNSINIYGSIYSETSTDDVYLHFKKTNLRLYYDIEDGVAKLDEDDDWSDYYTTPEIVLRDGTFEIIADEDCEYVIYSYREDAFPEKMSYRDEEDDKKKLTPELNEYADIYILTDEDDNYEFEGPLTIKCK